MIRRPPRSTRKESAAASDVYKRQALAWAYYGDRAITYLFGVRWLLPYRLLYVLAFFLATISDTEFIWTVAYVTVALMTIPNLIAITLMHKEVKEITQQYWQKISPKP